MCCKLPIFHFVQTCMAPCHFSDCREIITFFLKNISKTACKYINWLYIKGHDDKRV